MGAERKKKILEYFSLFCLDIERNFFILCPGMTRHKFVFQPFYQLTLICKIIYMLNC
jgi:hypothetical protein